MNHLIIDGFGIAFRSFFAFNTLMTKTGMQSGCIYGSLCCLRSLKKKHPSFHVTVAWDNEARRKKEIFPDYKANRPKYTMSDNVADLKIIFSALGATQAEMSGEEADDIIATLVKRYSSEDGLIYIYSSDKDLLQLVKDGKVIMIRPKTGEDKFYDEEAVRQEFGVAPEDLACYQAFRGDTTDNVPGVARVPSKIIASVVNQYKTPESVYKSGIINSMTEFQKSSFLSHEAQSLVNYSLVRLKDDLDCNITKGVVDKVKVDLILSKYEIRSISSDSLMNAFEDKEFLERQAPAVENYSLF